MDSVSVDADVEVDGISMRIVDPVSFGSLISTFWFSEMVSAERKFSKSFRSFEAGPIKHSKVVTSASLSIRNDCPSI